LAAVRQDRLDRLDQVHAEPSPTPDFDFHDRPVPPELIRLVRYYSWRISRYLHGALIESRYEQDFGEWQRLTLYKLSDALEHFHLFVGVIAAHLRSSGVPSSHLQRYLQVPGERHVEAFYTPRVEAFLAGLTHQPGQDQSGADVWQTVAARVAAGRVESAAGNLEVALNAVFANYPDDSQALDHLPNELRLQALALLPHLGVEAVADTEAGA
jgi:hypothetical protein